MKMELHELVPKEVIMCMSPNDMTTLYLKMAKISRKVLRLLPKSDWDLVLRMSLIFINCFSC